MTNSTFVTNLSSPPPYTLCRLPPLLPFISDLHLSLIVAIIAFWSFCLIFHLLEKVGHFAKYRLHTSAEETQNIVSRAECLRGVIVNQIIQTLLGVGLGMLGEGDVTGMEDHDVAMWAIRVQAARRFIPSVLSITGIDTNGVANAFAGSGLNLAALLVGGDSFALTDDPKINAELVVDWQMTIARIIYCYIVPIMQFAVAIFVADTWQYFGHRWEHTNKWVYKNVHSVHHGLYVPYSYGAAYTHILEGLFLDSLGTAIAFGVAGLTIRQGMLLYTYISFKAVTDHGGYLLPWDPLRWITENNAYFHDIHHQKWGTKKNFAVHFSFWDRLMGTCWTDKDAAKALYERGRLSAQNAAGSKRNGNYTLEPSNTSLSGSGSLIAGGVNSNTLCTGSSVYESI